MNETAEQVRVTLREVADEVSVPPFDEVAFRRAVRRSRVRRTAWAAGGVGVAAALVLGVGVVVPELRTAEEPRAPQVAVQPEVVETVGASELLTQPLFHVVRGRLRVLTPDGTVQDLGVRAEAVVGATPDGVLALDDQSRLVWFDARSSGEGDGRYTFTRGSSPVDGAVSSVALSGDGRYLAWLATNGVLTVRDLKAEADVETFEAGDNSYVASVSDRGVLVSEDGDLVLRGAGGSVPVPTAGDGYGWQSDVAGDLVSVADRDGVTRVYDVSTGAAERVAEVPGSGRLAPGGAAVVTAHVGGPAVRLWTVDGLTPLVALDLDQRAQEVAWLDAGHAVVSSGSADGTTVRVCGIATRACDEVLTSEDDVQLSD